MSQSPQDEQSLLAYLVGLAGLGITAALAWIWKHTMGRIDALEAGKASSTELAALAKEIEKRKDIEAKLFDMMREHEKQDSERFTEQAKASQERHDELMSMVGNIRVDIAGLKR